MIDIRQLRYFVAVAETLHFGRAAERLHVTQPPLSRQVAALEQELGVRLIERQSRRAVLTPAGARFLEDARQIIAALDRACRDARAWQSGDLGELTIGFMMHAAYSSVPLLTRRFATAHPDVTLHLRETLPMMLADNVIDLAAASWLASANYLGYLIGALLCTFQPWIWTRIPGLPVIDGPLVVRSGLVATGVLTFGMALPWPEVWPLLRFAAERSIMPRWRNLADGEVEEKSKDDLVTVADREVEQFLSDALGGGLVVASHHRDLDPALLQLGDGRLR